MTSAKTPDKSPRPGVDGLDSDAVEVTFNHRHLLGIQTLAPIEITTLLNLADSYVGLSRQVQKKRDLLEGRTLINMFFEASTRTQASFELAGKRLGADTVNMSINTSSVTKGETLIDTAITLNAMHPDILIVRHNGSGAVDLLAQKVDCAVVNAGDGSNEHPTQALLDALTIRRRFGRIEGLTVAICGDVKHSRVARSNIHLLTKMGARVRLIGPPTLLPPSADRMGVEVSTDMHEGLKGVDVAMMLRLQRERMDSNYLPSLREYYRLYGLDREKFAMTNKDAVVMHPGPMNRGVEIESTLADDPDVSLIQTQVEMGVAVRMSVLDVLSRSLDQYTIEEGAGS